jgi:hypothetical protein
MINLKEVLQIYKEKRIKLENESQYRQIWNVDGHTVMIQIKKGRRIVSCDCENHSRFCGSSQPPKEPQQGFDPNRGLALCRHKEAVIVYPVIESIIQQVDKLSETAIALKIGSSEETKKIVDALILEIEDIQKIRWARQLKYR